MEYVKRTIRTCVGKGKKQVQMTLDRDMNVPDTRPDVERLIQNKGEIRIDEIEAMKDRVRIKGALEYKCLYHTAETGNGVSSLQGSFDLEEYINVEGVREGDLVKVIGLLDDLNVMIIHGRKLGVRALLTFQAFANEQIEAEGIAQVEGEGAEQLFEEVHLTQMVFQKRDICRIHREMTLAASKPNIREVIWEDIKICNPEVRMLQEKVQIRGDMTVFFLYAGEEQHVPLQHNLWEFPFTAEITCPECKEGMIGDVRIRTGHCQLEVKPDEDGEERILVLDGILNLDMKGFEEEKSNLLGDIYSTEKELVPVYGEFRYENLLVKNNAKTRIQRRLLLHDVQGRILQMIYVDGCVKIDELERREEGIFLEGIVEAKILLLTDEDRYPFACSTQILPFSYLAEVKNIGPKDHFELEASLEQIQGMVLDGNMMELKAVVGVDVIAFSVKEGRLVTEVEEQEYDYEYRKSIPGVAVYIARKEESLWNVAKMYNSCVESIRQMNQLETDRIKAGQKIIVVKKVQEVL